MSRNVFILGSNPVGRFISSVLPKSINPSNTSLKLLFPGTQDQDVRYFKQVGSAVSYTNYFDRENPFRITTELNSVSGKEMTYGMTNKIDDLIVTERRFQIDNIIGNLLDNISSKTNIIFVNPHYRRINSLQKNLFDETDKCPNIYWARSSHVLRREKNFNVDHFAPGSFTIAKAPKAGQFHDLIVSQEQDSFDDTEVPAIITDILNTPFLNASYTSFKDVYISELESLMVDAIVTPLKILLADRIDSNIPLLQTEDTLNTLVITCIDILRKTKEVENLISVDPSVNVIFNKNRLLSKIVKVAERDGKGYIDLGEHLATGFSYQKHLSLLNATTGSLAKAADQLGLKASGLKLVYELAKAKAENMNSLDDVSYTQ